MDSNNIEINLINNLSQEEKDNQLIVAADNGLIEEVKKLVNSGANIESVDQNDNTPLRLASRAGYFEIADFLIKSEANIEAKNDVGSTPLMAAAGQGYPAIVNILINAGANLNAAADDGDTALMRAADDSPASAVLLVKAGADLEAKDNDGYTALMWAAAHGEVDTVDLLIESGANLNVTSLGVNTLLTLSVRSDRAGRLENSFRLISAMSDEQIDFTIKNAPRKNEDVKIKERVQAFKKAILENQKKMFDILDARIKDTSSFGSAQEFDLTVSQLSQNFPAWYTHRIPNDLKTVFDIFHQIRNKQWLLSGLPFLTPLNAETLLEKRYCRQNCVTNLSGNAEKSFFYDTAAAISSGCLCILNKASAYLPSFAKQPMTKPELESSVSAKNIREGNDGEFPAIKIKGS